MSPPRRVVLQAGLKSPTNLAVYGHIDPNIIRPRVAEVTANAAVVEFWGEGTSAYKAVLPSFGGSWAAYVHSVADKIGKQIGKTCLTTWSAGSQLAKDVCVAGGVLPDAIVMLDGLYGAKPPGSKAGDGQVIPDVQIEALVRYAIAAARGEKIMAILHSRIPTPYASSKEVADYIVGRVSAAVGTMQADKSVTAEDFDKHGFSQALVLGNLHVIEFPGIDAKEHVTEAHLYDEVWKLWVPWLGKAPPEPVSTIPAILAPTVRDLALALSLGEEAARVGETPPGSNKVKNIYWDGTTRLRDGHEQFVGVTVGPWCAAAYQWASYAAARQLGLDATAANWLTGPVPHGKRISVAELQHDITQRGLFKAAIDVRAGRYDPRPGEAVFLDRAGGAGASFGHVCRFVRRIDAETFETVGGNEAPHGSDSDAGDRWRRTIRRYDDPKLRGFGAFPDPNTPPQLIAPAELAGIVYDAIDHSMREWLNRDLSDDEDTNVA
jgi:hypothetical protein